MEGKYKKGVGERIERESGRIGNGRGAGKKGRELEGGKSRKRKGEK